ncbi:PREDICTED: ras-interacting protein RIP3-like [Rhagoletis zephyria]|uniref:ras-interacting protein RIP3-like n=1 Tax=Rhagoletis zephyria TaxID=28612 RepID=UPI00081159F7|nr:PREDICTED: ras-interacting protein RIP3-like [Rhagoletis zephyria]
MINLDSYCEICQKEFCNKYFLKKHKQKIHGYIYNGDTPIPPPNLAAQIAAASQQPNHPAQLQQLQQLQMLQHQMQLQQQQQQQQLRSSPDLGEGKATTSPLSPSATNGNGSTGGQPQLSTIFAYDKDKTATGGMNSSQTSETPIQAENSSAAAAPTPTLATPGAMAPEKLRSMGVINADAFCEICCKEFCNKYFLRTHKINKHGLLDGQSIPGRFPVESRLTAGNGPNGRAPFMFNSSSSSAANSDSGMEPGQRDPASYGKSGEQFLGAFTTTTTTSATTSEQNSTPSVSCELCTADQAPHSFPSTYLLNVHKAYYHDIPYASLNGGGGGEGMEGEGENGAGEMEEGEVGKKTPTMDHYNFEDDDNEGRQSENEQEEEEDSDAEAEVGSCSVPPSLLVSAELNMVEHGCGNSQSSLKSSNSAAAKGSESAGGQQQQQQDQLQKLHSMIKGLMPGSGDMNDEEGEEEEGEEGERIRNGNMDEENGKVSCHICKYDCENRYYLRAHLINEHGFPPTEEAFLAMLNATAGLNFLDRQSPSNFLSSPNFKGDGSLPGLGLQSGGNGSSEAYCELCNKEFCSKYFLKTHKARIHNIHEPNNGSTSAGGSSPSHSNNNSNSGMADQQNPNQALPPALLSSLYQAAALQQQQQQSAKSQQQQQQGKFNPGQSSLHHPSSSSSNSPTSIQATIKAALAAGLVPGGGPHDGGQQHPSMHMMPSSHGQPSSSGKSSGGGGGGGGGGSRGPVMTGRNYCNICNKELCNKYFMKTHMLKMHNINIDEHPIEAQQSSTIGGVTCDICQKELCSKYFLKVHKQNTHGIYEDGAAPPTQTQTQIQKQRFMA